MTTLKAGDEVRVFDVNGKRVGQPDGGWPGTIVKVGRTLVHVAYRSRTETFRIDGGASNDGYEHQHFLTMTEAAVRNRHGAARAILRTHKIALEYGHGLTLDQIEALAEVARTFTETTEG